MAQSLAARLAEMLGQELRPNPRRLVTRSGYRKRGFRFSSRFGVLPWESPIERRMLAHFDHSWCTARLEVQAIALRIPCVTDERGYFIYEPDAIALDHQQRLFVVEGKCFDDLLTDEIQSKHRDIRLYLEPKGVTFIEVSERDLGSRALACNLSLLSRSGGHRPSSRQADVTRARIRQYRPSTYVDLDDLLGRQRAMHALAHGYLTFNLHQSLGRDTALVSQPQEDHDAALFIYARTTRHAL